MDKASFQKIIGKLKKEIQTTDKKLSAVTKLSELSRTLANFMKSSNKDTIEIPGQYEMAMDQVFKESTIKIAGFKDEVKVFASLRKPIKITIIGDDGKDYDFLVKNGEDLRQDQRIGK
jgi:DNA-dependent protein kinase catalytic subunit